MDDQPFTTIEQNEFKNMVLYLRPNTNIPSADTIRRDLNIKFDKIKIQIYEKLQVIVIIIYLK